MNRRVGGLQPRAPGEAFRCQIRSLDDCVVVEVEGEVDIATAPLLHDALFDAIASQASCVVADLGRVDFMDSSGIHVIIRANNAAFEHGAELILRAPRPNVARVIELVGLAESLTVEARND
jgi:anti-sigma B factor antagonist